MTVVPFQSTISEQLSPDQSRKETIPCQAGPFENCRSSQVEARCYEARYISRT